MSETEELLWIASQEKNTIPFEMIKFACDHNIPLSHLLEMNESEFIGLDEKIISKFFENKENLPIDSCQQIFDNLQKERITLIPYCDPIYPNNLRNMETTKIPRVLYHQGKKIPFQNGIAIVGTRNASTHAIETARELGIVLSKHEYTVVSGLARGIDASAMRGSISTGGKTIAVLPWIHNPYPPEHERLLEEIKQVGSVVSENYVTSGSMDKYKFLQRNAIISALSEVLIAVESSYSGGTRWQVELALSQKKIVIAMEPEKSNSLSHDAFEKFIDNGATSAHNILDVLEILKYRLKPKEHVLEDFDSVDDDINPLLTQ